MVCAVRPACLLVLAAGCSGGGGVPDARPIDAAVVPDAIDCGGEFPELVMTRAIPESIPTLTWVGAWSGDVSRLYVAQKRGRVYLVRDGVLLRSLFLDVVAETEPTSENGLFALAFAADYGTSGRFWVSRTPLGTGTVVVEEYRRSAGDPDRADSAPVRVLAESAVGDGATHSAGQLAFGPDGALYWSVGDGRAGDSRDPAFLRGKIFRLDVDAPGTGPVDLADAIWARGLRNPWRFTFDRANGSMVIADVGGRFEEIDLAPPGAAGLDFGWPTMDGAECGAPGCDASGITLPAAVAEAGVVIGGEVYRGAAIPCLRGWYLYGDFVGDGFGRLRVVDDAAVDHAAAAITAAEPSSQTTSIGTDAAGELLVTDYAGGLFRISAP